MTTAISKVEKHSNMAIKSKLFQFPVSLQEKGLILHPEPEAMI